VLLFAAILLPSCNALFGIEEGRLEARDSGAAGSSGDGGASGASGSAGASGSSGSDASFPDGAIEAGDASGEAGDAAAVVCPLLEKCGSVNQCWCGKCRSALDACLGDSDCRAALECVLHTDCNDVTQCEAKRTTCPYFCSNLSGMLQLDELFTCAQMNPGCGACVHDRQCVDKCPVVMPVHGQALPTGCPSGGAICNYGSHQCQCVGSAWNCVP
jgi:hypothetical protein